MNRTAPDSLTFPRRGRRANTATAERMLWIADDGNHRVAQYVSKYETRGKKRPRPRVDYRAEYHDGGGWDILSTHRTRAAAEAACQRHAGGGDDD